MKFFLMIFFAASLWSENPETGITLIHKIKNTNGGKIKVYIIPTKEKFFSQRKLASHIVDDPNAESRSINNIISIIDTNKELFDIPSGMKCFYDSGSKSNIKYDSGSKSNIKENFYSILKAIQEKNYPKNFNIFLKDDEAIIIKSLLMDNQTRILNSLDKEGNSDL